MLAFFLTAEFAFVFSDLSRRPASHSRTVCFSAELPTGFGGSSRRAHVKLMEGMVHVESFALSFSITAQTADVLAVYAKSLSHLYSCTDIFIQTDFYCI